MHVIHFRNEVTFDVMFLIANSSYDHSDEPIFICLIVPVPSSDTDFATSLCTHVCFQNEQNKKRDRKSLRSRRL